MKLTGKKIFIRLLAPDDVTQEYVNWMRDQEIVQFLESRWRISTLEDIKAYVTQMNNSPNDFLFGIFLLDSGEHVGNIKIGNINQIHRFGEVGFIIGNKKAWGKGIATEAIELATRYAFEDLNLNKLIAGIYMENTGSYKALLKMGYREIGIMKKQRFCKGKYMDEYLVEKCRDD